MENYQLKLRVLYSEKNVPGGEIIESFLAKGDQAALKLVEEILLPLLKERLKRDTSIACAETMWNLVKLPHPVLIKSGSMV